MASFPLPTLPLKFGIHGSLLTLTGGVATALPPPTLPVLAPPPLSLSLRGTPARFPLLPGGWQPSQEVSVSGVRGEQPTQTNLGSM